MRHLSVVLLVTAGLWLCAGKPSASAQAPDSLPANVVMTAEEDHGRMMDLLEITSLRPGPSGDPSGRCGR